MTAQEVRWLAAAMEAATKLTLDTHVRLDAHGSLELRVGGGDATIRMKFDESEGYGEYVIDDRIGD